MLFDIETELSFFHDKIVAITGGTGFIGSALVRKLAPVAKEVHVLAQAQSSTNFIDQVIDKINLHRIVLDKPQPISEQIAGVKPNILIHCAEPSCTHLKTPSSYISSLEVSTRMASNLLEYALEISVEKLIHICSSTVYGGHMERDIFTENGPYRPDTYRGLIKFNERNLCLYYARKYDLPVNLARVFRAYGPYDSAQKLIVNALNKHNDGASIDLVSDHIVRDYIHVVDIVRFITKLCETDLPPGEEINVAGGKSYSARDIVTQLEQLLGTTDLISNNTYPTSEKDSSFKPADISKARRLLNWEPKIDLQTGLSEVIKWHQAYPKD